MVLLDPIFLFDRGFKEPNLVPYDEHGLKVFEPREGTFVLLQDGQQWMTYNTRGKKEVFEFYSHWKLARGHCICTGLGFALRENWLLSKKEVTKITVLESNEAIISYHMKHNPSVMEQLEIVHTNVYDYKGSCDTLLIDHFEGPGAQWEMVFCSSLARIIKNIKHERMWFWPFEYFMGIHYRNHLGMSLESLYDRYRRYFGLHTLPKEMDENQLFELCNTFFRGNFEKCDFNQLRHEI
jgi:hypothetical protein